MATGNEIHALFDSTPANALLGMQLESCDETSARVSLPVRSELIQEEGVVHGGLLSTLADTAAVYSIVPTLADGAGITGVEFKVNFMRPGLATGGVIEARAELVKRGRTLSLVDVEVFQDARMLV